MYVCTEFFYCVFHYFDTARDLEMCFVEFNNEEQWLSTRLISVPEAVA